MATVGQLIVEFRAETAAFRRELDEVRRSTSRTQTVLKGMGSSAKAFAASFISFQTARAFVRSYVTEVTAAEKSQAKLEAVLKATGYAARLTADDIDRLAQSVEQHSLFDDDEVKNAAAVLATFRNVQGDTFREGIQLAADMATVMGTDLQSSIIQLGKALNDPTQGVTALRRVGISFNAEQLRMIKNFEATGRLAEAQKIILAELRQELGGAADASNTGLVGAIHHAQSAWGDFLKSLAEPQDGILGWLEDVINGAAILMEKLTPPKLDPIDRKALERDRLKQQVSDGGELIFPKGGPGAPYLRQFTAVELEARKNRINVLNYEIQKAVLANNAVAMGQASSGKQKIGPTDEQIADAKRRTEKVRTMLTDLREDIDTFWMSADQVASRKVRLLGGSAEEQADAARLTRTKEMLDILRTTIEDFEPIKIDIDPGKRDWLYPHKPPVKPSTQFVENWRKDMLEQNRLTEDDRSRLFGSEDEQRARAQLDAYQAYVVAKADQAAAEWRHAWTGALYATGDAFADFFDRVGSDGLNSFKSLFAGILDAWRRTMAQLAGNSLSNWLIDLATPFVAGGASGLGNQIAGAGLRVGVMHTGGEVGQASASRTVSPALFAGAKRYHDGGDVQMRLAPDERPAILEVGERVLSVDQVRAEARASAVQHIVTREEQTIRSEERVEQRIEHVLREERTARRQAGGDGDVINLHFAYAPQVQAIDGASAVALLEEHGDVIASRVVRALNESRTLRQRMGAA